MRTAEDLDSNVVMELSVGTTLEVVEVGQGRRLKVRAGTTEGWISSKTRLNEPLIVKRRADLDFVLDDFEVGGQHEVKSLVTLRAEEAIDGPVIAELKPGSIIRILELGTSNRRRAKVAADQTEGWISLATKQGELLVGKVSDGSRERVGQFGASSAKIKTLLESARSGDLEAVKKIVEGSSGMRSKFTSRPNLNCSDIRGKTALIYAAAFGNRDVVEYLLSKTREIDVNTLDDTQKNALHHASKRSRARRTPEYDEMQCDIISLLLQAGVYLEARDHNGCTALMFGVANGDEPVVRKLLTSSANVHVKDFEGHTPMDYAKTFKHQGVALLLKNAGAADHESDEEQEPAPPEGAASSVGARPPEDAGPTEESPAPAAAEAEASTKEAAEHGSEAKPAADSTGKKAVKKKKEAAPDAAAKGSSKEAAGDREKKKKKAGQKGATADKGKKGKAERQRRDSSAGMMAAVEVEEETPVVVEDDAKEEVDEKQRALAKLAALLDTSTSPGEIEAAIKVAQANGAGEQDLKQAVQVLKKMKKRQRARDQLRKAVDQQDVKELRKAIADAEEHKVPSPEIDEARKVLAEEEPRQSARDQLNAARDSGNVVELKAALAKAREVGLASFELEEFEELLAGAESKEKAEMALKAAIEEKNVASLKFAIQQAKGAGIDESLIQQADRVLREEKPKQKARDQLADACENPTEAGLAAAIDAARAAKLDASEYSAAVKLLEQETEKKRSLGVVKQVLEDVQDVENEVEALREAKEKLSGAIDQAIQAGVSEADLVEADTRRKKLHNAVEDLKGSIRVYCRIRPLSKKEENQGDTSITQALNSMTLQVEGQTFQFDSVWTPGTQVEVFEDCKDLVQSAVDGYNVTMFAYGQTGAGKTFTMYGAPGMEGTAPRTIQEIFRVTAKGEDRFNYTVMGSMLELYRNDLVDLLSKGNPKATKQKLNVRQEKTGTVVVEHLTEQECVNAQELSALLERGNKQRTVAATAMNSESSRSHLVLIIKIVSVNKETKEQLNGKVLICDLAGSERLKKSQVEAHMQKEAIEINKSLTALGDVIEALTKSSKVVPYRNHKLTQLMQDSLGGTAKTLMFVNCSPANSNLDETLMSLKYATRAKKITNTSAKKS
eukprot:CAMPEP_0179035442 /NCGR_PEP_ID=MMETSP0796-20121207/13114_1 /TAXON_ID=73915 /ORGANISM="Pyrodinium bahamense, Strain pbaha01" /LENGTH=1125 /DNA_ID=CAMNT_0020731717 /DNA_START=303 /DNA_END=3680 /DNA_ORIENTATION=-